MGWILFLDDMREPATQAVLARSVEGAWALIASRGAPEFIHFDHDLGDGEPSGFDFAKALVERDLDENGGFLPPSFGFSVHSDNPPGAANIRGLLDAYLSQRQAPRSPRSGACPG